MNSSHPLRVMLPPVHSVDEGHLFSILFQRRMDRYEIRGLVSLCEIPGVFYQVGRDSFPADYTEPNSGSRTV